MSQDEAMSCDGNGPCASRNRHCDKCDPSTGQSFEDSLYLSERDKRDLEKMTESDCHQFCQTAKSESMRAKEFYQLAQRLSTELNKAHNLIRWLGRAYGDNEPIWAFNDAYGHELEANRELHRTWQQVMGTRLGDNPQETTEPGETPRPNESESSTNA